MVSNSQVSRLSRLGLATTAVLSLAGGTLAIGLATPAAAAVTGVVINEVESNGSATDWVELYNPTGSSISLSGAVLSDADDSHAFPLTGTIAAGGYAVFDVSEGPDGFGLGAPESVRLIDGTDPASDPVVDSTSWTTHASTTWGRFVNGSGTFVVMGAATRGASNIGPGGLTGDITGVVLNEVESDADATNGDWVELHNPTGSAITISGAIITDGDPGHVFTVPASTTLAAGAEVAYRLDGAGGFGLGAADEVNLYQPGDVLQQNLVDSFAWSVHAVNTYGRNGALDDDLDGLGDWAPTAAGTFAADNDEFSPTAADPLTGVVVSEAVSHGDTTNGDWIELHNTSGSQVDLTDAILSDDSDTHGVRIDTDLTGTAEPILLGAGQYAAFRVDDLDVPGNFGLGDADRARLFTADTLDLTTQPVDESDAWSVHARTSYGLDGNGDWVETRVPTFGAANDFISTTVPDVAWIVINEIESSAPSGGQDFIELKNTASVAINLTGAILSDSSNGNSYTIPTTTAIPAGGLYTVEIDNVTGGFGLGGNDAVRLYRPGATVGTSIPIDHHEWTAHAAGTYSRTASGLGPWLDCTSTKNAANAC